MVALNLTTEPPGGGFPWDAVIGLVPHLIWAFVVLIMLRWIGADTIRMQFSRLNKIGVAGLELQFRDELEAAVEARGKPVPVGHVGRLARRLATCAHLLGGADVLWVDDEPDNNLLEASPLQAAGANLVFARSTSEAIAAVKRTKFDLVISDIARGSEVDAGLRMTSELAAHSVDAPIIFYVGHADKPVPAAAFGIADRPDELLHLVLDALARRRG